MEEYKTPELPTYADDKPNLDKKIPQRWKNKVLIAGIGLLTTVTFTGCGSLSAAIHDERQSEIQNEIQIWSGWNNQGCWMHHGGSGGAPLYVAYLTEQEALGIIRAQLEEAGIPFDDALPSYSIEVDETDLRGQLHHIELSLFNENNNIAISIINPQSFSIPFSSRWGMEEVGKEIANEFEQQYPHISVSFFCNPDGWVGNWGRDGNTNVTNRERRAARQSLIDNLVIQTQGFIEHLREEGIIE